MKNKLIFLAFSLWLGISVACAPSEKPENTNSASPAADSPTDSAAAMNAEDKALWEKAKGLFEALPEKIPAPEGMTDTPEKVALGKQLFHDPRLSKSGAISCNSCHNLASAGVDNRSFSLGHGFKQGGRNAPTVLNAGFHTAQFWDLRAKDLTEQAKGPVLNPVEMAMPSEADVVIRLASIEAYQENFKKAFPEAADKALSYQNMAEAIAAFERTLVTPSRFDAFLKGKGEALSAEEKKGLETFIGKGCTACHSGVAVGGKMAQKFGIVKPYPNRKDMGKYDLTKKEEDKYVFKVPSLRNIARTYPYFHDGAVWELKEAIKIMGETQLGLVLDPAEIDSIAVFLNALTGELPPDARMLPELPASGPKTPQPAI
ncbi:cytochrome-c peroxidase [bacterium (Candidatus Blackallbacteria) CG17_big_fil_post_rev_8_21_14_2_50_48_46]|uniref:Cytochrome-c peroxidase n=1 Tax=bacterium (Candidatus Blackallbacteria) CG17_big_fil_post_rev_8_21_14_2_50_48_46 TaxID=2014261 RepID=A0A2M7G1T4_9BACT|nr:MAG: cytochrome-c peroxidase [bacterium (Candidatus Blackallbacteria) CG18_big_fil_WC_8_21_14_2_50_49_26]PIW15696.1 MAG: cytochrome-c peroxidase [bacterium (Candidatus Blackallbacteria) CG17_big_fil_post_rev_8_21_14_2_50_48_46]PIW48701.1 MAG: cytochrome-c peroxidase [bacterium (Candidatus Blackallbacteria) CG13_big_fil_rev_8_21_14_2_50_49_14]